jgi:hypothetical protein
VPRPLLVKAALLSNSVNYPNFLPTYHDSSLNWNWATPASFLPWTNDIHMLAGVNPGGPGFIGGYVIQGANKTTGPGDPLSNRLLLLTTAADVPVAYTYSTGGTFSFNNLAYGTYKLFGDKWGKTNPPLLITLSATNPGVNNVIFEENSTNFTGHIGPAGVNTIGGAENIKIYPNPATDKINVTGMEKIKGSKSISLRSMNGSVLYNVTADESSFEIPLNNVAAGIYVLEVRTNTEFKSFKVTK